MDGGPRDSGRVHRGDDDRTRRRSRGDGDEAERQRQLSDRRPSTSTSSSSPALDFLSSAFDAALALSTPCLLPPDPRAPVLDNVSACRRLLPPGVEGAFADAEWPARAAAPAAAVKRAPRPLTAAAAAAARSGAHRKRVPALDAIAEASLGGSAAAAAAGAGAGGGGAGGGGRGPLSLLKRAYDSKSRVRVLTRHARGVRGSAVGTLCGFDVFMNLILKDVVEEYSVRVSVTRERPPRKAREEGEEAEEEAEGEEETKERGGGGGGGEEKKKGEKTTPPRRRLRHCYRVEARTRSLRLVFLRGDSVVLVSSSCG